MSRLASHHGSIEPDLSRCRTTGVGSAIPGTSQELYYCVHGVANCRYARAFGYDYLCTHAENYAFAAPEDDFTAEAPVMTSGNRSTTCSRPDICPYLSFAKVTGCQCTSAR